MVPDHVPDHAAPAGAAMPIAVIAGTAGVGKTALAVRWAHAVRDRFPDGQLYVDMRGYTPGGPVRPHQALSQFLRAVGVPAEQVPVDPVEAAGMFRTRLADRRMLVLLDNVHATEQVRPLLPASPGCLVVVTSRDRLDGLVARDSARRATLGVLTEPEALALLGRMAGPARVAAEPEAAADLVRICARLPLALRITAAQLAARPGLRLADHLADLGRGDLLARLEIDGDTETAVGAAFGFSYGALKPDARRLFRLLGLVPGVDITAPAAAALAGLPHAEAARLLDRLAAVHLVDQHRPGRYAMHDLLRRYAAQQAHEEEDARERAAAGERLVDHYLDAVTAAADLLYPYMLRLPEPSRTADVTGAPSFADHAAALAWLDDERPNLLAVVHDDSGWVPEQAAWLLADGLRGYFYLRRYYAEWIETAERAFAVARAQGRPQACAAAHFSLGTAYLSRNQYPQAVEHYELAGELSRETGWLLGRAAVLINLGLIDEDLGDLARSAERCRAALALTRRAGSRHNEATALVNLGAVCELLGRLDEAAELQGRALEINRELGSRRGVADARYYLAAVAVLRGRSDEALADCTRALADYRELGARNDEALSLAMLAVVLGNAGRSREALEAVRGAVELAEETGEQRTEAAAHIALAGILRAMGEPEIAAAHDEHALRVAVQIGARFEQCQALLGLADGGALDRDRDHGRARHHADEALDLARDRGYRVLEGRALVALAELERAEGNSDDARKLAESGLAIHRETGYRRGQAEALRVLGSVHREVSGVPAAIPVWREAHALLAEIGSPDAAGVQELLAGTPSWTP
jgi:tetratricopeptide (TPR) repeat protein